MTTGTLTPTVSATPPDVSERYITYFGTMAISNAAHTYATGGVVCSFAGKVPQNSPPAWVEIESRGPSTGALCNTFRFVPGTTIALGKVLVLVAKGNAAGQQALEELANSTAFNNAIVRLDYDAISFRATFRKE